MVSIIMVIRIILHKAHHFSGPFSMLCVCLLCMACTKGVTLNTLTTLIRHEGVTGLVALDSSGEAESVRYSISNVQAGAWQDVGSASLNNVTFLVPVDSTLTIPPLQYP